MNFVWYIVSFLVFTFLFWNISKVFKKGILFMELLGIILYTLFYSIGIAAVTSRFALNTRYSWIYFLLGGFLCFNVSGTTILFREIEFRPVGNLIIILLSILFYAVAIPFLYKSRITDYFIIGTLIIAFIFGLISNFFGAKDETVSKTPPAANSTYTPKTPSELFDALEKISKEKPKEPKPAEPLEKSTEAENQKKV